MQDAEYKEPNEIARITVRCPLSAPEVNTWFRKAMSELVDKLSADGFGVNLERNPEVVAPHGVHAILEVLRNFCPYDSEEDYVRATAAECANDMQVWNISQEIRRILGAPPTP